MIPPEVYQSCIDAGYISSVSTLMGGAEGFGLDVDTEMFERGKRLCAATGLIDDFLDGSPDHKEAWALYSQGLSYFQGEAPPPQPPAWADGRLEPAIILLGNAVAALPELQQQRLVAVAETIGEILLPKCIMRILANTFTC